MINCEMCRLSPDTTDKLLNGTFDLPGKLKFNSNPGTPNNRYESFFILIGCLSTSLVTPTMH